MNRNFLVFGALTILSTGACSGAHEGTSPTTSSPIVGGKEATAYPEAVLVDVGKWVCSGSVIAPRVVLTAGHCVIGVGKKPWVVTAPYADGQSVSTTDAAVYDYKGTGSDVNAKKHDVGLLFLPAAIKLSSYPTIAQSAVADGSRVVNIGRIDNGTESDTSLFVGPVRKIKDATGDGYPFDYISTEVIEEGDSGGPVVLAGTHTIVAVNSGADDPDKVKKPTQVLARVDLLADWIQGQISAHSDDSPSP